MITEERDSSVELGTILAPSSPEDLAGDLVITSRAEPVAPPGITAAESQEFQAKAATAIKQLEESSGGKEMELVDSITAVGVQAQRHAGRELELLRARVGDMMTRGGPGEKISQDLLDLRLALDQINPHELNRSWFRSVVSTLPLVNRFSPMVIRLKKSPSGTRRCPSRCGSWSPAFRMGGCYSPGTILRCACCTSRWITSCWLS